MTLIFKKSERSFLLLYAAITLCYATSYVDRAFKALQPDFDNVRQSEGYNREPSNSTERKLDSISNEGLSNIGPTARTDNFYIPEVFLHNRINFHPQQGGHGHVAQLRSNGPIRLATIMLRNMPPRHFGHQQLLNSRGRSLDSYEARPGFEGVFNLAPAQPSILFHNQNLAPSFNPVMNQGQNGERYAPTSNTGQNGVLYSQTSNRELNDERYAPTSNTVQNGGLYAPTSNPEQNGERYAPTSNTVQNGGLYASTSNPEQNGELYTPTSNQERDNRPFIVIHPNIPPHIRGPNLISNTNSFYGNRRNPTDRQPSSTNDLVRSRVNPTPPNAANPVGIGYVQFPPPPPSRSKLVQLTSQPSDSVEKNAPLKSQNEYNPQFKPFNFTSSNIFPGYSDKPKYNYSFNPFEKSGFNYSFEPFGKPWSANISNGENGQDPKPFWNPPPGFFANPFSNTDGNDTEGGKSGFKPNIQTFEFNHTENGWINTNKNEYPYPPPGTFPNPGNYNYSTEDIEGWKSPPNFSEPNSTWNASSYPYPIPNLEPPPGFFVNSFPNKVPNFDNNGTFVPSWLKGHAGNKSISNGIPDYFSDHKFFDSFGSSGFPQPAYPGPAGHPWFGKGNNGTDQSPGDSNGESEAPANDKYNYYNPPNDKDPDAPNRSGNYSYDDEKYEDIAPGQPIDTESKLKPPRSNDGGEGPLYVRIPPKSGSSTEKEGEAYGSKESSTNSQQISEPNYKALASTITYNKNHDHVVQSIHLEFNRPSCANDSKVSFCLNDPEYPRNLIERAMDENDSMSTLLYHDNSAALSTKYSNTATVFPPTDELTRHRNEKDGGILNSPSLDLEMQRKTIRGSDEEEDELNSYRCSSTVHYAKPVRARNIKGDWKVIVNLGEGSESEQVVRLELCTNVNSECIYSGQKVESKCFQKQEKYRLLAWTRAKGLHADMFYLPVACSCFVGTANAFQHHV